MKRHEVGWRRSSSPAGKGIGSARSKSPSPRAANKTPPKNKPRGPFLFGEKWWLNDPIEMAANRYDGRGRQLVFFTIVAVLCCSFLGHEYDNGRLNPHLAPIDFAKPAITAVPLIALVAFRFCCAAVVWGLVYVKVFTITPFQITFETLERRDILFKDIGGLWRFQGLTSWGWVLLGVYFTLSGGNALYVLLHPGDANIIPTRLASFTGVLLLMGTQTALLITCVVTFVLIPSKVKLGLSIDGFYTRIALLQHNANLAMIVIELLIGGVSISARHTPFCILFGLFYVAVWHQTLRYALTHTLMYSFLNWHHPHSLKILTALILVLFAFSGAAALVEVLRPKPWGPPLIVVVACLLTRTRRPK